MSERDLPASEPGQHTVRGPGDALASLWISSGLSSLETRGVALDATVSRHVYGAGPTSPSGRPAADAASAPRASLHLPRIALGARQDASADGEGIDFEEGRLLGEGGMGRVLLARQHAFGRDVALKRLRDDTPSVEAVEALLSEARVTGALEHPHIVPVHALGLDEAGRPLMVMKRVEGVAWSELLAEPAHPAWASHMARWGEPLLASIEVLIAVAEALEFAHARGVVHRDVKPANVMIGAFGEVYLVDWGLAVRRGEPGPRGFVGTPAFVAPEMVDGNPETVDARTDVYLLGATLHNVLTGRARHEATTLFAALGAALMSAPVEYDASVPEELGALANRATSREPTDRPASAQAFRAALEAWKRHRGSDELARETAERARRLEGLAANAATGDAEARVAFDRVATECRFGFTEALRQWPENRIARDGLSGCLRAMIDVEVARGNDEGARSLLAELDAEEPALVARISVVGAQRAMLAAEAAHGRRAAREFDERVGSHERSTLLTGIAATAASMIGLVLWRETRGEVTLSDAVVSATAVLAAVVVGAWSLRRTLLVNVYNRRVASVFLVSAIAFVLHRASAAWSEGTSMGELLRDDAWIAFSVMGTAGFTVQRRFFVGAAIAAVVALGCSLDPAHARFWFMLVPVGLVLLAFTLRGASAPPLDVR